MAIHEPPICKLAKRLGDNLFRLRKGVKLVDFCKKVGLSKSSLARVESGNQNLTLKKLQEICDHLGCDIGDLFRPPPEPEADLKERPIRKTPK